MKWAYRLVIERVQEEDGGGFRAYFPTLGLNTCYGVGDSIEELLASLRDSIRAYQSYVDRYDCDEPTPTILDHMWVRENAGWIAELLGSSEPAMANYAYAS